MRWARQLDTGDVALANSLISHCLGRKSNIAPGGLTLAACRVHQGSIQSRSTRIDLASDNQSIVLWLEENAARLLFGDVCWSAFDQDVARLFVADHFEPALADLSKFLNTRVTVHSIAPDAMTDQDENCIALHLQQGKGESLSGYIYVTPGLRTRLTDSLPALGSSKRSVERLRLSANIFVGIQRLSPAELSRIEVGSVVLLLDQNEQSIQANKLATSLPVMVAIGEQLIFAATLTHSKIQVTSNNIIKKVTESAYGMNSQSNKENDQTADQELISLTFRLGKAKLTLVELQSMAPGFVLPVAVDAAEPVVDICVGLEPIGRGRVVQIGEQLGVEVTEWGDSND